MRGKKRESPRPTKDPSRRTFIKDSVVAAGAAVAGGAGLVGAREASAQSGGPKPGSGGTFNMKTILAQPDIFYYPGEELAADEIRVSVMGSGWGNIARRRQAACSLFIELGNGDSFVWDMGEGSFVNYNAMQVPYSSMDKVFVTHLHMDHTTDILPLYCFGPSSGDRFSPLKIWGPSGQTPELGVKYMMETGLKAYTNWHTTSFRTAVPGTSTSDGGYGLQVTELDYKKSGGIAYQENGVTIKYWPALHVIDGAIGYRLDWNGMSVCWSGDTNPSHFFVDNCQGVDLMFHETAPTVNRLSQANAIPEKVANMIIDASHTPARALGKIFDLTKPSLGVTVHCPIDPQEITDYVSEVRVHWKGAYQIAEDFFVFNVSNSKNTVTVRQAAVNERSWAPNVMKSASLTPDLEAADYRKSGFWSREIKDY